jgi:hypothetical protein
MILTQRERVNGDIEYWWVKKGAYTDPSKGKHPTKGCYAMARKEGDNGTKTPTFDQYVSLDTGGYTGEWGPEGRLAMLHQKEIVLNARDTENMLAMTQIVRDIAK